MMKLKLLEDLKNDNFDVNKKEIYIADLDLLEKELNFFRSIDLIKLGKYIEYDATQTFDLSGWEFLAGAWRKKSEATVLWYLQQRFNKEYHWTDIFDKNKDEDNQEFRSILVHYGFIQKKYFEGLEEQEKRTCKNCYKFKNGKCEILNIEKDIGGCGDYFIKRL